MYHSKILATANPHLQFEQIRIQTRVGDSKKLDSDNKIQIQVQGRGFQERAPNIVAEFLH